MARKASAKLIEIVAKRCNLGREEVVENALMLLGYAISELEKGNIVASVNENKKVYTEIQLAAFEAIRPSGPNRSGSLH